MKKFVSFLVIGVLLSTIVCGYAENRPIFDHTLLEGKTGYQYDKFDKTWQYAVELLLENDKTTGMFFLFATGSDAFVGGSIVCAVMKDSEIKACEKAMILLNEEIITIDSINKHGDSNSLLPEDKDIISRIIQADAISIRLISENSK